jgi:hypothetical protein
MKPTSYTQDQKDRVIVEARQEQARKLIKAQVSALVASINQASTIQILNGLETIVDHLGGQNEISAKEYERLDNLIFSRRKYLEGG